MKKIPIYLTERLIGERIKEARVTAGLSQAQLGEKIAKSGAAIGYMERAERSIFVEDLIEISKVLEIPLDYFFTPETSNIQRLQTTLDKLHKDIDVLKKGLMTELETVDQLQNSIFGGKDVSFVIKSIFDPIALVDKEGKIISFTPTIKNLLEQKAIYFKNKQFTDYLPDVEIVRFNKLLKNSFSINDAVSMRTQMKNKKDNYVPVKLIIQSIKIKDEEIAQILVSNPLEEEKIKEQFREITSQIEYLFNNVDEVLFSCDLKTNSLIQISPSCQKVFGYKKEDLLFQSFAINQIVHKDDKKKAKEFKRKLIKEKKAQSVELRIVKPNGEIKWVEFRVKPRIGADGNSMGCDGIAVDISKRKLLEEIQKRYEFIVNSAKDWMTLVAKKNDHYVFEAVNDAYCKMHKKERGKIIGKSLADIWSKHIYLKKIKPHFDKCFTGKEVNYKGEFKMPSLGMCKVDVGLSPYFDKDGKVTHAVVVTRVNKVLK